MLDPDDLRPTLIAAAVCVLSFETLRTTMIDRLKTFFSDGWTEAGPVLGRDYEREVSTRSTSPLRAAMGWHVDHGVIDDGDVAEHQRRTTDEKHTRT